MGEIVPNQLFVAGYSRNKIPDEKGIKDLFKKYGNIKDVVYKGSYSFVKFSSESEAEDALKGLNGQTINGQKLKVDVVDNRKGRRNEPQQNDECFKCGEGGHWFQGQRMSKQVITKKEKIFQFKITTQKIKEIQFKVTFLFFLFIFSLKEKKRLQETKQIQQKKQKPKKRQQKKEKCQFQEIKYEFQIQIISQQLIEIVTQDIIFQMRKDQIKKKEIRNQILPSFPFFIPLPIISGLLFHKKKHLTMSNSQAIEKTKQILHFYYYQFIEKMSERFEQNLQQILSIDCQTVNKNLLLKGQIELLKLKIRDQKIIKQQQEQELREIEKKQVMQNLKEEQQKQIEDKEIQLIKQKKELHLRLDACEDLQFEIEQQYQHLKIQQENQKILDESIKRLMDCIQRSKKSPLKNQQLHNRVATSHSFDDRVNPFGIMGMLKSKNNVDDYILKVEKINTSRLYDH